MVKLRNNLKPLLAQHYNTQPDKLPPQQKIADDFGVSQTTVSRWLSEKVDRFDSDVLERFCRPLKCNVGDLIYFDEKELFNQQ